MSVRSLQALYRMSVLICRNTVTNHSIYWAMLIHGHMLSNCLTRTANIVLK